MVNNFMNNIVAARKSAQATPEQKEFNSKMNKIMDDIEALNVNATLEQAEAIERLGKDVARAAAYRQNMLTAFDEDEDEDDEEQGDE